MVAEQQSLLLEGAGDAGGDGVEQALEFRLRRGAAAVEVGPCYAGTGKTTMLNRARTLLEKKGEKEMRGAFAKTALVVDEGSLASTVQARDLLRIADAQELRAGDRRCSTATAVLIMSEAVDRNRLTLVPDRSSDEWKRTMELYEVRNQIAHGDLRSEGMDVSPVIEDFFRIRSSLARD